MSTMAHDEEEASVVTPTNGSMKKSKSSVELAPLENEAMEKLCERAQGVRKNVSVNEAKREREYVFPEPGAEEVVKRSVWDANSEEVANWLAEALRSKALVLVYFGFEAFYDPSFEAVLELVRSSGVAVAFSKMVKTCVEYMQDRERFEDVEEEEELAELMFSDGANRLIAHLGGTHSFDKVLFGEDSSGFLQRAWRYGRLVLLAPKLVVTDRASFPASLGGVLAKLAPPKSKALPVVPVRQGVDEQEFYESLDKVILEATTRVSRAKTIGQVLAEAFDVVAQFVAKRELDAPCLFDSGWEAFALMREVQAFLAPRKLGVPLTRTGIVNARNAAIGDALHAFYAMRDDCFPIVVTGDTAAYLAGGLSIMNIHVRHRFGAIVILNNQGMAIEDRVAHRTIAGHHYNEDLLVHERKRDIVSLDQLKDAVAYDIISAIRDYLWGTLPSQAKIIMLNVNVNAVRANMAMLGGGDNPESRQQIANDFGARFHKLAPERAKLEEIIDVLFRAGGGKAPVTLQACPAIEFMELISQLTMTKKHKLKFLPEPTDILATRTLLPALTHGDCRTLAPKQLNECANITVYVGNEVFGLDGLNNLISTHLEYGTSTFVHLLYFATDRVTKFNNIGQVHRGFGVRTNAVYELYQHHMTYEDEVRFIHVDTPGALTDLADGITDPAVKAIVVNMGCPDLPGSF